MFALKKMIIKLVAVAFIFSISLSAADLHPRNFTSSKRNFTIPINQNDPIEFLIQERAWYRKVEAAIKTIPIPHGGFPEPFLNQCKEMVKKFAHEYFQNAEFLDRKTYAQILDASSDEIEKAEKLLRANFMQRNRSLTPDHMNIFRAAILKIYNFNAPKSEFDFLKMMYPAVGAKWKDFGAYWYR